MKLLIVEDEQVTRENLGAMLDYQKLGFSEVCLAADGEDGLRKAREAAPEVVLTDIRMPRMDGIEMAEHIRDQFPKCQIIFLSAYEELEYYKAAIRLKTISYIEKPVASAELERVLRDAAGEWERIGKLERFQSIEELENRKPLAYRLTLPNQRKIVAELMEEEVSLNAFGFVTTMLLAFRHPVNAETFVVRISDWAQSRGQVLFYAVNSENCYILQLLTKEGQDRFVRLTEERLCAELGEETQWYLSVGDTVTVGRSYQSYQTAAIGMQRCFFEPYGYVAYPAREEIGPEAGDDCRKERAEISAAVGRFALEEVRELEAVLFRKLQRQKCMLSGKIRGMYCDFFEAFFRESEQRQIASRELEEYRQLIRKGDIEHLNCIELHETFNRMVQTAERLTAEQDGEYSLILMIKKYVEDNYENPQFSLPEVAEYVHLSVSYICVVFKAHTGRTINQYLTEIRMKQAQKYLTCTRYSLVEISRMVGYQDSSYFGRIFKKTFQITPIEYRERKGEKDA